jgi:hypothetical protein
LVIERYDRRGLDWVDDHAKFQAPGAPRRLSAYRIAELLGSLQGDDHPVADFLCSLTFTVLLGPGRPS